MVTITVGNSDGSSFSDPGTNSEGVTGAAGSLSHALAQANATTDPVVINLTSSVTLNGPLSPVFNANVTVNGNGFSITSTSQRVFFVGTDGTSAGEFNGVRQSLTLNDLTLTGSAIGGAGGRGYGGGGGGGLGAGGAIFVNRTGDVTLNNVNFSGSRATGGAGELWIDPYGDIARRTGFFGGAGGGGGLGGSGSLGSSPDGGRGGGGVFGNGGSGGAPDSDSNASYTSIYAGSGGSGGFGGGGGGGGGSSVEQRRNVGAGGDGGFGGGGGGGHKGGDGGFGGGGGSAGNTDTYQTINGVDMQGPGESGFGATSATTYFGGNGAGLGGAVFVAEGGTLMVGGTSTETGSSARQGGGGTGYGAGIFFQGSRSSSSTPSVLRFGAGTQSYGSQIADLDGASGNTTTDNGFGGAGGRIALLKTGGGSLTLGVGNTYTGGITIGTAADTTSNTLVLNAAGSAGSGAITFRGLSSEASATLVLGTSAQVIEGTFGNTLNDFGDGEALVLRGFAFSGRTSYTVRSSGLLTLENSDGAIQRFRLTYTDEAAETTFYARDDGQGGTILSSDLVCYAAGTRIRTASGESAVEGLSVGDHVVTASGALRPIRWIGHRTLACRGRSDALPVRIAVGAFGEGRPSRDLFVSPAHAIAVDLVGEVLIPACRLINGTTITQVDVETITYWHVELDSHDILLAEGLPAESYLDCGNRRFFADAEVTDLLAVPDARPEGPLPFCHPFHETGLLVDLVRVRLRARAEDLGWRKVEETFAGLHLFADGRTIRPDVQGLTARFVVPADALNVRLISETSVPAHVVPGSSDDRRLGVALTALTIDDGLTGARIVALDDARLGQGFHSVNGGARWTDGSAVLPADLWASCKGSFFLRVTLAGPALPRWIAPGETASVVGLVERRKV